jgi:WD40 repeat protein
LTFLKEACAGDADRFGKLKELLDSYAEVRTATGSISSTPATRLLDPETLVALAEQYEDIRPIGRGGMGIVLRAKDRELNRVVALKMLHPSLAGDERAIERFRNEIRLALDVTHKNVCRTYGLVRVDGKIFIAMEYVEGKTLRSILDCTRGVSVPQALSWAEGICDGLTAAHERGIVHCDLKPANIMIDRDGHAKVMDFGIAGPIEAAEREAGTVIGTPQYMSPEQAAGRTVGPPSDIYSLGLVLYEIFSGVRRDPEHPVPPSVANPYLPPHIDRAILQCLQPEPKLRLQTATELIAALTSRGRTGRGWPREFSFRVHAGTLRIVAACALLAVILVGILRLRNPSLNNISVTPDAIISGQSGTGTIKLSKPAGTGEMAISLSSSDTTAASVPSTVMIPRGAASATFVVTAGSVNGGTSVTLIASYAGTSRTFGLTVKPAMRHERVNAIAFSPDGRTLASAGEDTTIKLWDVQSQQEKQPALTGHSRGVADLAFSSDGHWLASGGDDMTVRIWNIDTSGWLKTLTDPDKKTVTLVALNRDGTRLASTTGDTVIIWDVQSGRRMHVVKHKDYVSGMAFSPDGVFVASGDQHGDVIISKVEAGDLAQVLANERPISAVAFSPDGQWLATGVDKLIKMRRAGAWDVVHSLSDDDTVEHLAFNLDGQSLASGTHDNFIALWIAPSWERPKARIKIEPNEAVAFSPDLRYFAVAHNDGTIALRKLSQD